MTSWCNQKRLQLLSHITFGKVGEHYRNKYKKMRKKQSIIVAGNGPSLTEIDYSLLPENFDTFRLNNFYFEDKYYLGKHVSYYYTDSGFLKNQYFNIHHLNRNNEYTFNRIFSNGNASSYPSVEHVNNLLRKESRFGKFMFFYDMYYKHWVSSGPFAFWLAIMLGYKKIYLTGIDFYESKDRVYPWDQGKAFQSMVPRDATPEKVLNVIDFYHPEYLQIEALLLGKKILKELGGEVYCISPNSSLIKYVDLPTRKGGSNYFCVLDKKESCTRDWLPLPEIKDFKQC